MKTLQRLKEADVGPFLALAQEEGWICGQWEFVFLLRNFPQGCLVAREEGEPLGYITSVHYESSGWVGNLLVRPQARSRGIGRLLMERAISELLNGGAQTIWLTASAKGAELYRKLGFRAIDNVSRWVGEGELREGWEPEAARRHSALSIDLVSEVDFAGWGDRRSSLLKTTCSRGTLYNSSGGFLACQDWEHGVQIGPWGSLSGRQAGELLDRALAGTDRPVFLDVPAGNHGAASLLVKKGFAIRGSTTLMYLGAEPRYRAEIVFALASMGSMG